MKICVNLEVSQSGDSHTFDLDDLNLSEEEWNKLSSEEKIAALQNAVDELPESPHWIVDAFQVKN